MSVWQAAPPSLIHAIAEFWGASTEQIGDFVSVNVEAELRAVRIGKDESERESLLKAAMERFDVKPLPSRSRSKTALYVTPQDRVTEFGSELYEDGGKLYCSFCNVVLNHVRKSAINDHLKSKTHTKRKGEFEEQSVRKKPRTLTASLQCNSTTQTEKPSVVQDFVKMFLEANIPLEKADHPAVRAFLSRHVKNGNSIPKADQLRKMYLSDGFTNQLIKSEEH
ncbi:hypothetical protein Chor_000369 [Crotalus horridus]